MNPTLSFNHPKVGNKANMSSSSATQKQWKSLVHDTANLLLCGPDCQNKKKKERLKQKYLDAETNMETAPLQLEHSKKNYYTFARGSAYYENQREKELATTADGLAATWQTKFDNATNDATTWNATGQVAWNSANPAKELLAEYLAKNEALRQTLKHTRGSILTNDRKTFYETDAMDELERWYKVFYILYYVIFLMLVLSLFLSPNDFGLMKKIVVVGLGATYPMFIRFLVHQVNGVRHDIQENLPKNVYNSL